MPGVKIFQLLFADSEAAKTDGRHLAFTYVVLPSGLLLPGLLPEASITAEDNDNVVNHGSVLGKMEKALDSQHVKKRWFRKITIFLRCGTG